MPTIDEKLQQLHAKLTELKTTVVAFSGGVDSTFLLKAAIDALGKESVLAAIGVSPSLSEHQHRQARQLASQFGVRLEEIPVGEMEDSAYRANKADRCFHCKSRLFLLLRELSQKNHIPHILCGTNFDDKSDYRPGNRAAEVFGVLSPMMDIGLTKADIRQLSRTMNLPTADLPASPCLASRVAYGLEITEEKLSQVEKAEAFLRQQGFVEFRVRHHGDIARIEIRPADLAKMIAAPARTQIVEHLKSIGFHYITLDLQGFRSGSMNERLSSSQHDSFLQK